MGRLSLRGPQGRDLAAAGIFAVFYLGGIKPGQQPFDSGMVGED
jgi:hypothetical protein